ncbi:MAG: T9SS type A sorting domain-containing protein [Crocinitomicaceae bacterium]|nr:T9SS type A sorting domain-containing protein [Crocinitomicaceae bacterium]
MKKKLLSLLALASLYTSTLLGQSVFIDEDFNSITPGTVPVGWTVTSPYSHPETWQVVTDLNGNDLDGSPFLFINDDEPGPGADADDYVEFNVPGTSGATNLFLEFDQYYNWYDFDEAEVQVWDGATWQTVLYQTSDAGAWGSPDHQMIDISVYNNGALKIRFHYNDNFDWGYYWAVDNVVVRELLCPDLTNLNIVNILNDTLIFNFNDPSTVGQFNVEWGPVGFAPGMGQQQGMFSTTSTQDSVLNFPIGSYWQLYVQSDCGGTDLGGWLGPIDFYIPFCDPVTGLTQDYMSEDTLVFSFNANPSAINYHIEWGAAGFTPGNGEELGSQSTTGTQDTIFGWAGGQFYDLYVMSECTPGSGPDWVGPLSWGMADPNIGYLVWDSTCTTPFEDISATGTVYNLGDDDMAGIILPFPFQLESLLSNEISIGDNGGVSFGTTSGYVSTGGNIGDDGPGFYLHWTDMIDDAGPLVYEVRGTAPNRRAIVQWDNRAHIDLGGPDGITFQLVMYEGTNEFNFVYQDVVFGDSGYDYGADATVGVEGPDYNHEVSDAQPVLTNGMCIHWYYVTCPMVDDVTVTSVNTDSAFFDITPFGTETEWKVEYGPAGFTPGTGMSFITNTTSDTIPGLMQYTEYDIYVYAACSAGDTSMAYGPVNFWTDPVCPAPTGFMNTYNVTDTLIFSWTAGGSETMWNIEYGAQGFTPGTGTMVAFDTNPDTLVGLADGMVFDFVLYADCGGGTNNPYVGPITVATPLVNDSTCFAVDLMYDSTYVYSNIGATIHTGETKGTGAPAFRTVWFKFVSPASGKVEIDLSGSDFDTYTTVYSTTDCGDWAQFNVEGFSDPYTMSMCGLSPSTVYYIQVDGFSGSDQGIINIRLTDLEIEAGTVQTAEVCAGATLNLNSTITGGDMNGMWSELNPMLGFVTGSNYNSSPFQAAGTYEVEYRVTNACGYDSVIVPVQVLRTPSAGMGGTISQECNYGTVVLTDGLSGTVDLGGVWYDSTGTALSGNSVDFNGEAAGQYNYSYVASNGVCPNDTAMVTIDLIDCTSLTENDLDNYVSLYPNPTSGIVFINNHGIDDDFVIEVLDVKGKLMNSVTLGMNKGEVYELDLNTTVKGVYLIRIKTSTGIGQHRVIVQ